MKQKNEMNDIKYKIFVLKLLCAILEHVVWEGTGESRRQSQILYSNAWDFVADLEIEKEN